MKKNNYKKISQERDTACCLREDQAGCVQTQKSECKGAEGHNPPRTETLGGIHKWVRIFSIPPKKTVTNECIFI